MAEQFQIDQSGSAPHFVPEKTDDQKLTHAEVHYESPTKHEGQYCHICENYIKAQPPRCKGVKSPIGALAWCVRFEAK